MSLLSYPAGAATNLLTNPGFETGTTEGWTARGGVALTVADVSRTGSHSVLVTGRTATWHGVQQSILGLVANGQTCTLSGWVKLDNATGQSIGLTVQQTDGAGTQYKHIHWSTGSNSQWTQLSGQFTLSVTGTLTNLTMYFEGPPSGTNFYVDDASLVFASDWKTEANERIEQIRKSDFTITALSPYGDHPPLSDVTVDIDQTKHAFPFGSAINTNISRPQYAQFFKDHFNWAVCENEAKWYSNEPSQGYVTYTNADNIYNFCKANNITMRGHCIFWEAEGMIQSWVKALDNTNLQIALQNRLNSAVNHFKGKYVHWDVNNEMCNNTYWIDRLGPSVRPWMFQQAHALDPDCLLFINDYNVISGGWNLAAFHQQAIDLQAQGAPIHGLGVQCHMSGGFNRLDAIARFNALVDLNLPIWVTEFDVSQVDENLRANDLEDFYRIAFSHPSVEGILMWGFWENSHWRDDAHMVNSDWTLNAAGLRYEALMNEWSTADSAETDAAGAAAFRGFHGTYTVTLTPPGSAPTTAQIEIVPGGQTSFTIQLEDIAQPATCLEVQQQGLRLPADLNGDCAVGLMDLTLVSEQWLSLAPVAVTPNYSPDLEVDESIDLYDFARLAEQWLFCNDPENLSCSPTW